MGSQQAPAGGGSAHHQLEDSCSWTIAAYGAVQDIAAALQAGRDDVQPLDDAPSYQAICSTARAACSQAERSMCSSIQQAAALHPKELETLGQLSTATLQLSSAVCCDPAVALPLISSGAHAPALEQLKGAVKCLTGLWAACMEFLQNQGQPQGLDCPNSTSSSQQGWQCLTPALASTVKLLLHMSVTSAEFVSSGGSSQQVPKEMCSMSALNLSWANLTRLLVAIPEGVRVQVMQVQDFMRGLQCALQQLHAAVMDLPVQPRERQEVLVRFWLQSVSRLTSAAWEDASTKALQPLLQVTLEVYSAVVQQRQEFAEVQDILQTLLQPRLLACVSSLFANSSDPAAFQAKLDLLLQPPTVSAQHEGHSQHQQQEHLQARVHLALDALQEALPSCALEHVAPGCKRIVCWALSTTGQDLLAALLASSNEAPAAVTAASAAGASGANDGAACDAAGLELARAVLQGCLVGLLVCWTVLQDMQQQQMELLAAVSAMALSAHPLVSFLAGQLLADLVAAAGSSELASQQLALLHKLMGASAAAAALPGASWDACPVVDTLTAVLQVCNAGFAREWLTAHVMPGLGSSHTGDSSPWLDAGACALLVLESTLLQRLVGTVSQQIPVNQAQLQEAYTQLWSTAAQLAELLEPVALKQLQQAAGDNAGGDALPRQQAETLLVLHQISWLFQGMRAILQLLGLLDAAAASNLKQEAAGLAIEVLRAAATADAAGKPGGSSAQARTSSSSHGSSAGSLTAVAVQLACTTAVLRLLSVPGQLSLPEGQARGLLGVLRGLAEQHAGLHGVLAGVLGGLGSEAVSGNREYEELFQLLLASPHSAAKHAAFSSLLQLLRHTKLGNNIVNLLPVCMRNSATDANPEAINVVKAYVSRQADPQAQASFTQHYPHLAAQHQQQLCVRALGRASSGLLGMQGLITNLQELQQLLAACDHAAGSAGSERPAQQQQPVHGQGGLHADGAGGAQALLVQAAAAARKLQGAQEALAAAEAELQLLLSAASAAARDHTLSAEGIVLISREGNCLMGNVASMISRLRGMQDGLSTLRGR